MKIVCVIPARLASSRFPRKILSMLGGKPMLQWIWERAVTSKIFDEIFFAIDDVDTARLIDSFKGRYYVTSTKCLSGTDRLVELQKRKVVRGDIWVNWQGDEPFIHLEMLKELLQTVEKKIFDVYSLKKRICSKDMIKDPNIVKVVTNKKGKALYFSRTPIPYYRDGYSFEKTIYYKHIGIYAFTQQALAKIALLPPTPLELAEELEQLRFLEGGLTLQIHDTEHETMGIDLPEDLVKATKWIHCSA